MPTSPTPRPSTPDWGLGRYERTAAQLLPVAEVVVDEAAPRPGERVLDIGCGTGNATLLAARRGASAIGVDPAARLLEVARASAAAERLEATFALGDAAALPLADGEADVVVSVFGIIFAPDARAAAAEIARVTAPRGRVALSAWIPGGAMSQAVRGIGEAVARALKAPPAPPPFAWHDRDALVELLAPHGFEVQIREHGLGFTAKSPSHLVDAELANHPLAVAARGVLEPRGEMQAVRDQMLAICEAANEDPEGFRVTSQYIVATAFRRPE